MTPPRDRSSASGFPPPLKGLGQHFLSDPRILDRIAEALALRGDETVVEIGPGRGGLTDRLRPRAGRVVVIEIDRALAAMLRARYADEPRVEVVEADALEVHLADAARGTAQGREVRADLYGAAAEESAGAGRMSDEPRDHIDYVVVGNVPYYITTPLLFHSLLRPRPSRAVFLVQREVAERIVSPAGSESYGALSANVQALAEARILFRVPPGAFQPPPKVDSAVIRIAPLADPLVRPEEERSFRTLVQGAFGLRRKQMRKVLRTLTGIDAQEAESVLAVAGVDPDVRPETLGPDRFAGILRALGDRAKHVELRPDVIPDS